MPDYFGKIVGRADEREAADGAAAPTGGTITAEAKPVAKPRA
jgi:hypothetical protein